MLAPCTVKVVLAKLNAKMRFHFKIMEKKQACKLVGTESPPF